MDSLRIRNIKTLAMAFIRSNGEEDSAALQAELDSVLRQFESG